MDKKLTKSTKICCLQNKQTYPTVQIVTDNTITQAYLKNWPALSFLSVNNCNAYTFCTH